MAVMIMGLLSQWKLRDTVQRASNLTAAVGAIEEPVCIDPRIYRRLRSKWGPSKTIRAT
jgi:hypothetical protein